MTALDWRALAACAGITNPERFAPVDHLGRLNQPYAAQVADEYCRPCPARTACAADAARLGLDDHIIRGGWWWRDGKPAVDLLARADGAGVAA